jgi:hypothetical protein
MAARSATAPADQTMRFAKLLGIGHVLFSGQLMCTAPETCWNKRIAPFQDCVAPTRLDAGAATASSTFASKRTSDAREQACGTAKVGVARSAAGTKLGPFESDHAALPTGCDGQQWLPLQTEASLALRAARRHGRLRLARIDAPRRRQR